jgi:hypothetical protein
MTVVEEDIDKNSMLYWWPIVKDLGIVMPRTELIPIKDKSFDVLANIIDGKEPFAEMPIVKSVCAKMGYPIFLRTDHLSGKHDWERTCFIEKETDLPSHIGALIEESLTAGILGVPFTALAVRNYIPMDILFTAFWGKMPVNPEIRVFVKAGVIQCRHWYWITDAIRNPSIEDWKEVLDRTKIRVESSEELDHVSDVACLVAQALHDHGDDEQWSVDFCRSAIGEWVMIDMAIGRNSWHQTECPNTETPVYE